MSGAYRDTGAAIARAEALEVEVEDLRAEIARLKSVTPERKHAEPKRLPPNVERLENLLIDARAENELLRSQLAKLEGELGNAPNPDDVERERRELRREIDALERQLAEMRTAASEPPPPVSDNRDAVIKRLAEQREELERELKEARDRYEAEPPASRDPRTFEEKVLGILNRLVK